MEEKKYLIKCKLFVKVGEGVAEAKKYVRAEPSMRLPLASIVPKLVLDRRKACLKSG